MREYYLLCPSSILVVILFEEFVDFDVILKRWRLLDLLRVELEVTLGKSVDVRVDRNQVECIEAEESDATRDLLAHPFDLHQLSQFVGSRHVHQLLYLFLVTLCAQQADSLPYLLLPLAQPQFRQILLCHPLFQLVYSRETLDRLFVIVG